MYAYISGTIDSINESQVIVDNGGIGYAINASNQLLAKLPPKGSAVKIYTYTHVKEDCFELYGFGTVEDKSMFLKLISVSGVGCKSALQILSNIDVSTLTFAIAGGDVKALSGVKGIGKKTAERIIIELKEKVNINEFDTASLAIDGSVNIGDAISDEAVMALVALGIGKSEAVKAVTNARKLSDSTEKIITLALRSLAQ